MKIFLNGQKAIEENVYTIIDEEDAVLTRRPWTLMANGYAYGRWFPVSTNRPRPMHRIILERKTGRKLGQWEKTDHINRNKLDNRRTNLRPATHQQNKRNAEKQAGKNGKKPTSKYKGVSFDKTRQKWMARIKADNRQINLGRFDSEKDAAKCYDEAAKKYFAEFAYLNFQD